MSVSYEEPIKGWVEFYNTFLEEKSENARLGITPEYNFSENSIKKLISKHERIEITIMPNRMRQFELFQDIVLINIKQNLIWPPGDTTFRSINNQIISANSYYEELKDLNKKCIVLKPYDKKSMFFLRTKYGIPKIERNYRTVINLNPSLRYKIYGLIKYKEFESADEATKEFRRKYNNPDFVSYSKILKLQEPESVEIISDFEHPYPDSEQDLKSIRDFAAHQKRLREEYERDMVENAFNIPGGVGEKILDFARSSSSCLRCSKTIKTQSPLP